MQDILVEATPDDIPISTTTKAALTSWLDANPAHRAWISATKFTADAGAVTLLPGEDGGLRRVLAAPNDGGDVWAFAGLPMALPEGRYRLDGAFGAAAATNAALGWALGAYAFSRYKKAKRGPARLAWPENADRDEVCRLARGVFLARDLINTPAEDMGPEQLVEAGAQMARGHGAEVRVTSGDALLKENYPAIHAVGRASTRAPALLDFRWGENSAPRVTLVGKGVCFDTGGLDIKAADGMLEMKKDMGGAAVVLGLAQALMDAKARIRLRVLIPAVENSISGNAMRPRDIIKTRAGLTVEIGNTDAEGRLILCDALSEADSEAPDLLIDCATLTGAARVALGVDLQATYCDDDEAAVALCKFGALAGDPLWRMPIWRPYRKLIDGKCADLNNVASGPMAGSIIAALFLAEFVKSAKTWAHLDIMASNPAAKPGRPEGGEATGMRALYAYIVSRYGVS